ncbi:MAG: gluconolactonase [Alteromonadaceae bacterium]|nr:gluconolactonase [Alteromonadaceae bacterium]
MTGHLQSLFTKGHFFEGPRWHDGRWWASDFYSHTVWAITTDGSAERILTVNEQPSGLGWMPDGSLLVVSMRDHKLLRRWPDGRIETHADLSAHATGWANDMVVDSQGRAWVGNFGCDLAGRDALRPAALVRVDPDGTAVVAAEDLYFPNGSVITPDGGTLIVGETFGNCLTAFTIERDGRLTDRRPWATFGQRPAPGPRAEMVQQIKVAPDGCCLDAEGFIWVADAVGQRCIRVAPGGGIVDEVKAPQGQGIFACMLGGDDGRTLLLCCAPDSSPRRRSAAAEAELLTCEVEVPHAGRP